MILPRGEVLHKNLSTAYTDFHALLSSLKSEGFSGTVEVEYPEKRGVLFIGSGEIVNAEAQVRAASRRLVGQEAIQILLTFSDQKEGIVNVYRLPTERVTIVANHLQNEVIFKGLSTDFTRLDKLLLRLREEKHDGFIEILTKTHEAMGVLFLEGGEPIEMFTTPESGPSVFGRKSVPIFVENASKQGAILNVYRSFGRKPKEKEEPTPVAPGEGLKELILIFQDILSKAEKFADSFSEKGTFLDGFRKALLEKAEEYPFLDPFAGEFEYRDGAIRFFGEATEKDFAKGIVECLRAVLPHLEKELPKGRMRILKLRTEIESSLERHNKAARRLGVDAPLTSFLR
jgi:hypothetical protein